MPWTYPNKNGVWTERGPSWFERTDADPTNGPAKTGRTLTEAERRALASQTAGDR